MSFDQDADPSEPYCLDGSTPALALMRRFREVTPGVLPSELRVAGFSSDEVQDCFARMLLHGMIVVSRSCDADGNPFRGGVVATTGLGVAVLEAATSTAQGGQAAGNPVRVQTRARRKRG
ncbi:MAG: hypothetical protein ACREPD_08470 [Stenotrophomonas sp.]|uniref:hypothetical protein n=1 Tax=Stenotrophomonas sp. TaxID=69392 RepID=UPI003D6CD829